jgi:hypothetical protein
LCSGWAIQTGRPVAVVSPEPLTRRTMRYEDLDHTHKIASGRFESKCMPHSPTFDIVAEAGGRGSIIRRFLRAQNRFKAILSNLSQREPFAKIFIL